MRPAPARMPPAVAVALVAGLAVAYAPVARRLIELWRTEPVLSYGMLVPVWSAWLLWDRRAALRGLTVDLRGLPVAAAGLGLLAAGARLGSLTIEALSLPIVLAGAAILALGLTRFRDLAFPLGFLVLMAPMPPAALPVIALPLQQLAATATHVTLVLLGIPVYREGLLLHLSTVTLAVTEACSGLRFLFAMGVVGPALAWAVGSSLASRAALVLAALVVAVAGNVVRVASTAVLAHHFGPAAAMGFFHVVFGKVVYLLVLVPLALGLLALRRRALAATRPGLTRC